MATSDYWRRNVRKDGPTDGWINGRMDRQTVGSTLHECADAGATACVT